MSLHTTQLYHISACCIQFSIQVSLTAAALVELGLRAELHIVV
jgi:hypothetical protein